MIREDQGITQSQDGHLRPVLTYAQVKTLIGHRLIRRHQTGTAGDRMRRIVVPPDVLKGQGNLALMGHGNDVPDHDLKGGNE
ncbi:hypothetical protein ASF71_19930 [Deinococcus sp. Leaf326]|nr:hypothetical protein ASF71_19930 [Deinococcus sp. Leaf326]